MIRLAILLILLLSLAQPAPAPPRGVIAHWTDETTAVIRWEQVSEADTVCVRKDVGDRWVLINCMAGRRGWHTLPLPPGAPADWAHWPQIGDLYWIMEYKDKSPLGPEYGPYGLYTYWLPLFGAG